MLVDAADHLSSVIVPSLRRFETYLDFPFRLRKGRSHTEGFGKPLSGVLRGSAVGQSIPELEKLRLGLEGSGGAVRLEVNHLAHST